jgi:hypothetical protein
VVFSGTLVSSINKTDRHDITEILLKVTLNTINHNHQINMEGVLGNGVRAWCNDERGNVEPFNHCIDNINLHWLTQSE